MLPLCYQSVNMKTRFSLSKVNITDSSQSVSNRRRARGNDSLARTYTLTDKRAHNALY